MYYNAKRIDTANNCRNNFEALEINQAFIGTGLGTYENLNLSDGFTRIHSYLAPEARVQVINRMNIRSVAIQREHWTVSRCLTALSGFPFFPIPSIMRWMGYHCSYTLGQNNGNALIQAIQRTYKPSITACQVGCCIIWHSHQNCHLIVLLVQFRRRESLDWSGARRRGTYWLLSNEKEFEHIFWSHWLCDSIKIRTVKEKIEVLRKKSWMINVK